MLCQAAVLVLSFLWFTGDCFPSQNTPPVFDLKREWLVVENEPLGSRIVTVRARDDENDPIEYGLEPAVFLDGSSFFRIDKWSGEVFLKNSLIGYGGNDYYLFITANDGHQTAKIEVYVRIISPNRSSSSESVLDFPMVPKGSLPRGSHRPQVPHPQIPPGLFPEHHNPPPPSFLGPTSFPKNITSPSSVLISHEGSFTSMSPMPSTVTSVSTSEASDPEDKAHHLDWSSPLSLIVAIGAFASVVIFFLWILHRKRKTHEKIKAEKSLSSRGELSDELDPHSSVLYLQRPKRCQSNRYESGESSGVIPENRKWEFPRHHLRFVCLLGEGCFGQVWKCEALNIANTEGASVVAVKTLKENATEKEKKDLIGEPEVMKLLEPHPNVVTLLGCCTERDPLFLLMEFMENGKLQSYLRESRAERFYGNLHGASRNLTSHDLTAFAYQVSKGMDYLASKGIIHRDLAARNVLVGENKTCKVADFGFARDVIINHIYERKSEGRLPIRWMAPESLFDNIYTSKTDVWSFGILMWEIVTLGSTPYPGMAASEVMRQVRAGYRLEKPDHCKREVYNIMFYCWDKNPVKRPTFSELVELLDKLLVSENDYIELDRFPDHSYYNITDLSGEKL